MFDSPVEVAPNRVARRIACHDSCPTVHAGSLRGLRVACGFRSDCHGPGPASPCARLHRRWYRREPGGAACARWACRPRSRRGASSVNSYRQAGLVAVTSRVANHGPLHHNRHPKLRRTISIMPSLARCEA
jgi:hypothetical protein